MLATMMSAWSSEEQERIRGEFGGRARDLRSGLESGGLARDMTAAEREFFAAGLTERTDQQYIDSAWATESVGCCVWALGLTPELTPYDNQAATSVLEMVPKVDLPAPQLRSSAVLEHARAVAELWHWRSRTRQLVESGDPLPPISGDLSLDDIVRMTAEKAAEAGDIPSTVNGDFPAHGKAYRDLSADEYASVSSIALERHRALNWICGRAPENQWDETPTDT